ncbi:hypothetical protein [Thalassovita sp.]|uniref:hypothetical protein n=1 Tax=Thalassovita sp. TaxID=1979401 RepID=UPI002B265CAD|nr:hypothetical protein [Thalassovita sp.]
MRAQRNILKTVRTGLFTGCALLALETSPLVTNAAYAENDNGARNQGQNAGGMGNENAGRNARDSGGGGLNDIFRNITGMGNGSQAADPVAPSAGGAGNSNRPAASESDEDSDRPDWAGQPGGKDGAGGGRPASAGSNKGDLFGDLWIILRDENGVPILTPEGFVQPLDSEGNLIPLDEEGHPVDETLTMEVELGRLNVGRSPSQVLDTRADEVIALLNAATAITLDPAGRIVLTVDGVDKTIDSPLENLAIYVALLTTGTIPGVADLPGTEFDFLVDGVFTAEDLAASTAFLAAATDKTGVFTADEIAYINAFLGINTATIGSVTYSEIDYSTFTYSRLDTYGDVTAVVLIEQPDGSFVPTEVNIYDAVFGTLDASAAGSLEAYTLAADDARMVVEYIHEYAVPEDL